MRQEEIDEIAQLRARVDELEREKLELQAKTNELIAAAQERVYWLDRWGLDLNAAMRRRGAGHVRAGLRGVRAVFRWLRYLRRRLLG